MCAIAAYLLTTFTTIVINTVEIDNHLPIFPSSDSPDTTPRFHKFGAGPGDFWFDPPPGEELHSQPIITDRACEAGVLKIELRL